LISSWSALSLREALRTFRASGFKRAGELDPTLNLAFRGPGVASREAGLLPEAAAAWEKALSADPKDGFSRLNIGLAYLDLGRKDKARAAFEAYLKLKGSGIVPDERSRVQALIEKSK
jgi:tetratricopeptide (TPR) repeat protein